MEQKEKINSGEIKCGFLCRKTYGGQKDFDQDYVSITIKKVGKKTGQKDADGEDIYVLEDKVIESRKPIKEVIEADAENTGIDAYMKPYILSGTEPNVSFDKSAPVQDFTKMPDNLADSVMLSRKAAFLFDKLPDELKNGATSVEQFFSGFTQEQFMSFVKKHEKKVPVKKVQEEPGKEK